MHKIKLIRNVVTMLAIVFISAVLCGAGCSNVAASSGGGGSSSGPSDIVPNISSAEEFAILGKYNLGGDTLTLNADKTGNFKKSTPSASIRAAGDALTFDASINSLTWSVSGNNLTLTVGGNNIVLTKESDKLKTSDNKTFEVAEVVMSEIAGKTLTLVRPSEAEMDNLLSNTAPWYFTKITTEVAQATNAKSGKGYGYIRAWQTGSAEGGGTWEIKGGTVVFTPDGQENNTIKASLKLIGNEAFIYYENMKKITAVYSVQ